MQLCQAACLQWQETPPIAAAIAVAWVSLCDGRKPLRFIAEREMCALYDALNSTSYFLVIAQRGTRALSCDTFL